MTEHLKTDPFTKQTPMDWEKDRQLVSEAKQDPQAFGGLYERYVDRIYSFFIHWGHSKERAEDLTSTTFLNALKAFPGFTMNHDYAFAGWIFKIAKNQAINRSREDKKHPRVPLDEFEPYLMMPPRSSDPVEHVLGSEQIGRLRLAVLNLPSPQKTAILLRFGQDLTNLQVGQLMGISEGATKSRIHRALKNLKNQLEENT